MIAKPAGKLLLRQFAIGKGEDYLNGIPLVEHEFNLIHREEEAGSNPSSSLVTIHKRMIAGDAVSVSCGYVRQIIRAIIPSINGPRQCRFKKSSISDAAAASMFGKLSIVDFQDDVLCYQPRFLPFLPASLAITQTNSHTSLIL